MCLLYHTLIYLSIVFLYFFKIFIDFLKIICYNLELKNTYIKGVCENDI